MSARRIAVIFLTRNPGTRAYGMLMDLTHDEIDELYSESSVRVYRPEAVLTELADGSSIPALCFNLAAAPDAAESNRDYAAKLRDLARKLDLPSKYADEIL